LPIFLINYPFYDSTGPFSPLPYNYSSSSLFCFIVCSALHFYSLHSSSVIVLVQFVGHVFYHFRQKSFLKPSTFLLFCYLRTSFLLFMFSVVEIYCLRFILAFIVNKLLFFPSFLAGRRLCFSTLRQHCFPYLCSSKVQTLSSEVIVTCLSLHSIHIKRYCAVASTVSFHSFCFIPLGLCLVCASNTSS
jgi:hypothetical protein